MSKRRRTTGSPTTHYLSDPYRGDKRAHAIAKMHGHGYSDRKIAKTTGLPLSTVRDVIERGRR